MQEKAAKPLLEIEAAVIRLLAARDHSRCELTRKLGRRFGGDAPFAAVLDDLEQRGLLSDGRFAEQYVEQRIRRGFGPLRIRAELNDRGVDGALIDANLDLGSDVWAQVLTEAAARRFGGIPPTERKEQARRARFLQYRGFPESMIRDYLWH